MSYSEYEGVKGAERAFNQLNVIFGDTTKELTSTDRAFLDGDRHVERGLMLLKHMTGNDTWKKIGANAREEFLCNLTCCIGRQLYHFNLMEKRKGMYMSPNKCEACAKEWVWDILPITRGCTGWCPRTLPYPDDVDDWMRWRRMGPADISNEAINFLQDFCKEVVNETNLLNKEVRSKVDMDMIPICYWEAEQIFFFTECILHGSHSMNIDFEFYTMAYRADEMKIGMIQEGHKWVWKHDKMFVIDQVDGHFCLMCFEKSATQVVIWDGSEGAAWLDKTKKEASKEIETFWYKNVKGLLGLFGELPSKTRLLYTSKTNTTWKRPRKQEDIEKDWSIMSVTERYPEWQDKLIIQYDEFRCGAIAILHFLMVLGKEVKNEDLWESIDFPELLKNWVKDCTTKGDLPEEFNCWYDSATDEGDGGGKPHAKAITTSDKGGTLEPQDVSGGGPNETHKGNEDKEKEQQDKEDKQGKQGGDEASAQSMLAVATTVGMTNKPPVTINTWSEDDKSLEAKIKGSKVAEWYKDWHVYTSLVKKLIR